MNVTSLLKSLFRTELVKLVALSHSEYSALDSVTKKRFETKAQKNVSAKMADRLV